MKKSDTKARAALIAGWLAKFDAVHDTYGKGLADRPGIFDSWEAALSDLPVQEIQDAMAEWLRIGRRFPNPGDVRSLITQKRDAETQNAAELAWHDIRWRLTFFSWDPENGYLPLFVGKECRLTKRVEEATDRREYDGGWLLSPKVPDARTQHAIEAVGGLRRIAELPAGSGFDFCHRAFLEAYRSPVVERLQLGKNEAKALLETIETGRLTCK